MNAPSVLSHREQVSVTCEWRNADERLTPLTGSSREDLNSVYFDSLRFDLCFDSRVVYTSCDLLVFVPVWKCWCFQLLDCRGVKQFGNLSMSRLLAFKVHTLVWTKYNNCIYHILVNIKC